MLLLHHKAKLVPLVGFEPTRSIKMRRLQRRAPLQLSRNGKKWWTWTGTAPVFFITDLADFYEYISNFLMEPNIRLSFGNYSRLLDYLKHFCYRQQILRICKRIALFIQIRHIPQHQPGYFLRLRGS